MTSVWLSSNAAIIIQESHLGGCRSGHRRTSTVIGEIRYYSLERRGEYLLSCGDASRPMRGWSATRDGRVIVATFLRQMSHEDRRQR